MGWNIDGEELEIVEVFTLLGVWLMKTYEEISIWRKLQWKQKNGLER